jgi:hypothetical protein
MNDAAQSTMRESAREAWATKRTERTVVPTEVDVGNMPLFAEYTAMRRADGRGVDGIDRFSDIELAVDKSGFRDLEFEVGVAGIMVRTIRLKSPLCMGLVIQEGYELTHLNGAAMTTLSDLKQACAAMWSDQSGEGTLSATETFLCPLPAPDRVPMGFAVKPGPLDAWKYSEAQLRVLISAVEAKPESVKVDAQDTWHLMKVQLKPDDDYDLPPVNLVERWIINYKGRAKVKDLTWEMAAVRETMEDEAKATSNRPRL